MKKILLFGLLLGVTLFSCSGEQQVGATRGVTDTEIIIGTYGPLTGPAAPYGAILKGVDCAFKQANEDGEQRSSRN